MLFYGVTQTHKKVSLVEQFQFSELLYIQSCALRF